MTQPAIYVLIALLVVARFLFFELRERRLSTTQLFVLPGILSVVAILAIAGAVFVAPRSVPELAIEVALAVPVGLFVGYLVARFTTVRTAADGTIFFRGSYVTIAIWISAFLLRLAARFALSSSNDRAHAAFANAALIVLVATALTAMRILVRRKALEEQTRGSVLTETAV